MDNHYVLMDFHKVFDLYRAGRSYYLCRRRIQCKTRWKGIRRNATKITVPAGKHKINIKVFNQANVPAIYVKGKTIVSDSSWLVTFEDKEWIDETGKTSDISATKWLNAGQWNFNDPAQLLRHLNCHTHKTAVSVQEIDNSLLVDFGKETFGFIKLHGLKGKGNLIVVLW